MFFVAKDETRVATVISMRRGEIAFGLQDKTCLKKMLAKYPIHRFCRCHRMPGNKKHVTHKHNYLYPDCRCDY